MTGKTYGDLTAVEFIGVGKRRKTLWKCRCACGGEKIVPTIYLRNGQTKSCGCWKHKRKKFAPRGTPGRIFDEIGKAYGNLTVLEFVEINDKNRQAMWRCRCACGRETILPGKDLRSGNTKSCGCRGRKTRAVCDKCGVEKYRHEFYYNKNISAYRTTCNTCSRREVPSEKLQERYRKGSDKRRSIRRQALAHYGGKCACCGETNEAFLAFDHINGGDTRHRGQPDRRKSGTIAMWLMRNGYPGGFQVLCHNCNWAKHILGVCSHQSSNVYALSFGA